jgi:hypothetical protein
VTGLFQTYLSSLYNRWKDFVVQDVPDDLAVCEFDCRTLHCSQSEWASCERRITMGRGELSPVGKEPRTIVQLQHTRQSARLSQSS